jgi:hypothetical protein
MAATPAVRAPTTHEKVVTLDRHTRNMEELARQTGIPVRRLFEARRRSDYEFRDPLFQNALARVYNAWLYPAAFSPKIEKLVEELRRLYDAGEKTELSEFIETHLFWTLQLPMGQGYDPPGTCYLTGLMLHLAAEKQVRLSWKRLSPEKIAWNAIEYYRTALDLLDKDERPGADRLQLRVQTSVLSVLVRNFRSRLSIPDTVSWLEESRFVERYKEMLDACPAEHERAWDYALQLLNFASLASNSALCIYAYTRLITADDRFMDANSERSGVHYTLATDPDLAFFREQVLPKFSHSNPKAPK